MTVIALRLTAVAFAQQQPESWQPSRHAGPIDVLRVQGQMYMLAGPASNAAVQVGPQGVLVVDTMREEDADQLLAAIRLIAGDKPIRYIVNTHAHSDHTGGNDKVAAKGSQLVAGNFLGQLGAAWAARAFIYAHENVLNTMSAPTGGTPAAPFGAWPTNTFFEAEKDMYFNGEGIELIYEPKAHTDGDVMAYFRGSDVIATGDILDMKAYPEIDLKRGGHVNGIVEALNRTIDLAISEMFTEGGTRIIPGHGRLCDEFDVVEYRDMMTIIRDRVRAMVAKHMTLEQVKASRPTIDYEPRFGSNTGRWTTEMFVEAVYKNMSDDAAAATGTPSKVPARRRTS